MKIVSVVARYLLGLMFTVFGMNGFLNFIHQPPPANPLAKRRPPIGHQKVLDVDRALRQIDAINDAMGPRLDGREPPLFSPIFEAQAL